MRNKMRFHAMSWLLLFICCGFCLCDEGYFGVAHDDFRKLCVVVTLPGKRNGPDPDIFEANWNKYLKTAGEKIFESLDMNEQLKVAEEHCKDPKPDNDPICAFRDFSTIGNLVKQDVRKLQETLSVRLKFGWNLYALYINSWFQHPRMTRLNCGTISIYYWVFVATMSHLPPFDLLLLMNSVYKYANTKGLRQEIDRFCPASTLQLTCEIKIWTITADKVDKLLSYVGRDQWDKSASEILKNATRLHFYAVKLTFLRLHPSFSVRGFLSTTDSEVKTWIKEITFYVFDSLRKNQIESLNRVIALLPNAVDLPCDYAAEFPSFQRTICSFNSMINSLRLYLANRTPRGKVKQIATFINYETFLREKRFEQILQLGETTHYSLLLVAQHLKVEMKKSFGELKSYFQHIADFDMKKANSDIGYIESEIIRYKNVSAQSAKRMDSYMGQIIKAALTAALADQGEAILKFTFAVAEACNPLQTVFAGGTASGVLDATQGVAQALASVAAASTLNSAFQDLRSQIKIFVDKLRENDNFLNNVASLVKNLKTKELLSSSSSFNAKKNEFLDNYDKYTPAVTKEDLRGLTVYWENLVDEACDILASTSGTISGIKKTVLAAQRTCPNAKVEVQKLITTYEEIYDFQFNLFDALVDCMRALTAYQAANAINSDFDAAKLKNADNPEIFAELELLSAFSMICYKISMITAIDSYCDVLTYTEGHLPRECVGAGTSITSLLSRTKLTCSNTLEFQRIPTKPSGPGDKAYLSLKDLYAGKTAVFKIPNSQWLIDHNWISSSRKNDKMFVHRFEIYLPVVSKTTKEVHVIVKATVGNQLTPPDGTEYVIYPSATMWYEYYEGESRSECRQDEISNPYNDKCRDMPEICPASTVLNTCQARGNICPSIYAQWNVNIYGYKGANLAVPSTDIPLRVAVQLCSIRESEYASIDLQDHSFGMSKSLSAVGQPMSWHAFRSVEVGAKSKCCGSNQYYDDSRSKCTACPSGSVDKYKGLFCGNQIRFVPAPPNETSFSFINAQTMCKNIASTQAMQEAVDHGYDACECGWFAEEIMRAPKPNVSCKENEGFSTINCNSSNTWGVYCVNNF